VEERPAEFDIERPETDNSPGDSIDIVPNTNAESFTQKDSPQSFILANAVDIGLYLLAIWTCKPEGFVFVLWLALQGWMLASFREV
jgi:hypothetical protein